MTRGIQIKGKERKKMTIQSKQCHHYRRFFFTARHDRFVQSFELWHGHITLCINKQRSSQDIQMTMRIKAIYCRFHWRM